MQSCRGYTVSVLAHTLSCILPAAHTPHSTPNPSLVVNRDRLVLDVVAFGKQGDVVPPIRLRISVVVNTAKSNSVSMGGDLI